MSIQVILVSHGEYAQGLHDALQMFVGKREDIQSIGLRQGEDSASLKSRILELLSPLQMEDEIIVLGDLIGGSPLTTMIACLAEKNMLANAVVLGGMNLAMALNAVLLKEQGIQVAKEMILTEAHDAVKEFVFEEQEEDDI